MQPYAPLSSGSGQGRILARLDALDAAATADDMDRAGYDVHALKGFRPVRYTIHVNGPWCITFKFADGDAYRVDSSSINEERGLPEIVAHRDPDRCPSHPGAVLGDILKDVRLTNRDIAGRLGISRQQLHDILTGRKPLSPVIAARVGKLVGGGTLSWVRLQAAYDAWHADREIDTSGIEPLAA